MTVFNSITVTPRYGAHTALITWSVESEYAGGDFYVFRSYHGSGNWEMLNKEPIQGVMQYEDLDLRPSKLYETPHYRILCEINGKSYDSHVVGIYDMLKTNEYRFCAKVIKEEYLRMSRCNGRLYLYYVPRLNHTPHRDIDTRQIVGHACEDDDYFSTDAETGGFNNPFMVWVEVLGKEQQHGKHSEDGNFRLDDVVKLARMMNYPRPLPGGVLVHPHTDDRYIIGSQIQEYRFLEAAVIAYQADIKLMPRSHEVYHLALPDTLPTTSLGGLNG